MNGSWARWGFRAAAANLVLLAGFLAATVATFLAGPVSEWWGKNLGATPQGLYAAFAFALLSLPLYLAMMACIHLLAPDSRKAETLTALALTAVFAALLAVVYTVQLAVVRPAILAGQADRVAGFAYQASPSPMLALDIFGYGFLGLASLCAVPAFPGGGLNRAVRLSLVASGLADLLGVFAYGFGLQTLVSVYLGLMTAGLVAMTILLAAHFRRRMKEEAA